MPSTYDKIATTTLGSSAADVTFTSFSGYTDLVLVINATMSSTLATIFLRFNNDTTNTYHTQALGNNSTSRSDNVVGIGIGAWISGYDSNQLMIESHILDYANTTKFKPVISRYGQAGTQVEVLVGSHSATAAVTSIKVVLNAAQTFQAGSTFTLYGILRA